ASFPVMIAHGRSFFPPHLVGRGVTLMNLFGIGGVGLMQLVSGRIHEQMADAPVGASYQAIFGFFAIALFIGLIIYLFSRDRLD
ncbi:MAG: nitrate/nitrite transporter NarK, partial [Paracoccaceae bacterium]